MATEFRVFRGSDTDQICGVSGTKAVADGWYFEPDDYSGDVLWSSAYTTEVGAATAASQSEE